MLSSEENELLTRVGQGTPMGEVLRRYWIPALISDELPEPDCNPVRIKLLGEELDQDQARVVCFPLRLIAIPHHLEGHAKGLRCLSEAFDRLALSAEGEQREACPQRFEHVASSRKQSRRQMVPGLGGKRWAATDTYQYSLIRSP